jgi:DNA invertase Pin-like site-specific DNA recombinase
MNSVLDNMATTKPTAVLYGRCSSLAQHDGDTQRRQWEAGEAVARQHGFTLSDERFFDVGVSAYRGKNLTEEAKLGQLLKVLKPGQCLIFESMDRFSRQDWFTAAKAFEKFLAKGINVIVKGQMVTLESFQRDPGAFLPVLMASHVAFDENNKRAGRVRDAWTVKRAEIKAGTNIRQRLPGWLFRERTQDAMGKTVLGPIKIIEERAATVKQIFAWARLGWGRRRIAQQLNADKTPTVSGQSDKWHAESLNVCVLRNRAVIGDYAILDETTGKPTGEYAEGIFPAIIDAKTFYAVAGKREWNAARCARPHKASLCLTSGLTFCPACHGPMQHLSCHNGGKVYKYLICQDHKAGKSTNPECKRRISYPTFEDTFLGLMGTSDKVKVALGQENAAPDKLAELRGRIAEADRKANNLEAEVENTNDGPARRRLTARLDTLCVEAEALRAELLTEEKKVASTTSPQKAYETWMTELAAHAKNPEMRERIKAALRDIVERINFTALDSYVVTFKSGGKVAVDMMEGGVFMCRTV